MPISQLLLARNGTRGLAPSAGRQPFQSKAARPRSQATCAAWTHNGVDRIGTLCAAPLAAALLSSALVATPHSIAVDLPQLQGPARVVDGDTLFIGEQKVRLFGVDAPEKMQLCKDSFGFPYKCGEESADALRKKLQSQQVSCSVKTKDLYGRNVASCSVNGEDVGGWLVQDGHAVAYRQYSKDYIPLEETAKQKHTGIWQGDFQLPSEWRKQQRGGATPAPAPQQSNPLVALLTDADLLSVFTGQAPTAPCPGLPIKGNINSKGEKIYHAPGGAMYESVDIDLQAGERYFCTAQEAVAAGWRASKR